MNPFRPQGCSTERGIALVSAMLIMILCVVVMGAFIMTMTRERAITSNVHTARSALFAADAGVRTVSELLADEARTRLDSLVSVYPGSGPLIPNPGALFAGFSASYTSANPAFVADGDITFSDSTLGVASQTFDYLYTITVTGTTAGQGRRQVQSTGVLRLSADRGSFADYLVFTDIHTSTSGGAVYFSSSTSFDGRVHTNGQFRFANNPHFADLVTSHDQEAWYRNAPDSPIELDSDHNGTRDVPSFDGGFTRGVDNIMLPANAFNQENAALGLDPASGTAPSNTTIRGQLGLSGSTPPPNGVYLVNSGGAVTGGIYVQGGLTQMRLVADTTNGRQTYILNRGGTITTIVVDPAANTTTYTQGASNTTYTGTPRGITYVNGAISDLGGPDRVLGQPPPALLDGQQMLVTATDDVVIQSDLTMDNFLGGEAVLGIFSPGGDVRIGSGAPNDIHLDAFLMAIGPDGQITVDNYSSGSPRGLAQLRGGLVARYYGAFGTFNSATGLQTHGYGRDFNYDRRGLIPPYFPSTGRLIPNFPSARTLAWKEL